MAEPDGLREFVAARQGALLRTAWLLTSDWAQAEDLVQATLAKVWPRWRHLVQRGDPEAYVRRVLVTTYLTWRRRQWRGEEPVEVMPETAVPGDEIAAVDLRDLLGRILPLLPARQRAVLVLRFYQDMSVEQVADAMGCSVGTVKSQTAKALARLAAAKLAQETR